MKMKLSYTVRAQQDLRDIYEYIAFTLLAPDAARNLYSLLIKTARSLQDFPERNPLYHEEPMRSKGLRFVPVKNYLMFYTINRETCTVNIVRILYGGMDISRQMEDYKE